MPILDQGYQHWNGQLRGHAWRWLTITRQGALAQLKNRWVWVMTFGACVPAAILSGFLVLWGLFEQKSRLLTPLLFLFQGLPEELRAGPRGYRTTFWTLAFNEFLEIQLFFAMALVLLVGPELISQDLRFNAMPLYFRDRSVGSTISWGNSASSPPISAPSWSCLFYWRTELGLHSASIPWYCVTPGACWRPRWPMARSLCCRRER